MKFANLEVFINQGGTVSINEDDCLYSEPVTFPVEMIPTVIKALNKIYEEADGQSVFLESEDDK